MITKTSLVESSLFQIYEYEYIYIYIYNKFERAVKRLVHCVSDILYNTTLIFVIKLVLSSEKRAFFCSVFKVHPYLHDRLRLENLANCLRGHSTKQC